MHWTLLGKIAGDLFFVNLSFVAAFYLRFWGSIPAYNWQAYARIMPWITLAAFLLFYVYGLYTPGRKRWHEIMYALVCAVVILFITSVAISYFFHQFAFPRLVFLISFPLLLVFMSTWRYLAWKWSMQRLGPLRVLVAGSLCKARDRARRIEEAGEGMYRVVGLLVDEAELQEEEREFTLAGSFRDFSRAFKNYRANGIFICEGIPLQDRAELMSSSLVKGLPVFVVPEIYEIMLAQAQLDQMNGIPVFRVRSFVAQPVRAWKRAMDIGLALVFGVIALPVVALAALAIKLESPAGPVFIRQERVGRGNKCFMLLKLRTMIPDAEEKTGPVLAAKDDSRITRVGRVLRASRIDELPQLWNVLKGEMSFIGPRPERPSFVTKYCQEVPGYDYRHQIKVGITGLAQVESDYSITPEDKLRFDLLYSKSISPLKDMHILFHTLKVMLMKDKAS